MQLLLRFVVVPRMSLTGVLTEPFFFLSAENMHGDVTNGNAIDHRDPSGGRTAETGGSRHLLLVLVLSFFCFLLPDNFEIVVRLCRWAHSRLERSSATLGGTKHAQAKAFILE